MYKKPQYILVTILIIGLIFSSCGKPTNQPGTPTPIFDLPTATALPPGRATYTPTPTYTVDSAVLEAVRSELAGIDLDSFYDQSLFVLLRRFPQWVVSLGNPEQVGIKEATLDNVSDEYRLETYAVAAEILDLLGDYDRSALAPEEQISYDVYAWFLNDLVQEQAYMYYDYLISYFPATSVPFTLADFFVSTHPLETLADAQDYVTRLTLVDDQLDQALAALKTRTSMGIIQPRFSVQWALYLLQPYTMPGAYNSSFYTHLTEKLDQMEGLNTGDKDSLMGAALDAVENEIIPAYREINTYLETLEIQAPDTVGVGQYPGGEEYYTYRLSHYTSTDMTAEEIHQLGLTELERIQADMRGILTELGYPGDGSILDHYERAAQESGFVSGGEVAEVFEEIIAEANRNLESAFDIFPQVDVIVIAGDQGNYYVSPPLDGSRPGAFYALTTGDPQYRYNMASLAYHEAVPGHHFQIAIAGESDLPLFRSILHFTSYTEGWALYAEKLAGEMGWYAGDPYGDLGRLQYEAFRAARLVVDTGLHTMGWTFEQAEAFIRSNTGYPRQSTNREVGRYSVWPGQATAYMVGMLKILELRQYAKDQLGDRFDLIQFHRVLLSNGSMPLGVLENLVHQYVTDKLAQTSLPVILFCALCLPVYPRLKDN